ncbi:response regulator [Azospirillum sp. RWY-5-1]|uniref:histidine kinase n=1 Tax=Azospirillum oleiclasticum TaxID=2735135 RepID=A0ABX2TDR3_9PROT|nr:ATP-binding protein [Azospirillum oleiclasticum]NYZ14662.1 response regulator [Azospirillum oleiclasticum]NYZ22351.1 response regulator [Azospirillum oleiclasticum]
MRERVTPFGSGHRPIRWHLLVLVLTTLIPMLVLAVALIAWNAVSQREATERSLQATARALMLAIDTDVAGIVGALHSAAAAGAMSDRDEPRFAATAGRLLAGQPYWHTLFTTDPFGRITADTASWDKVPQGAPYMATVRQAIITGRPAVSRLLPRQGAAPDQVAIVVPVAGSGGAAAVGVTIRPERWSRLLQDQKLPDSWLGVLVDDNDAVLARNRDHDRFVGQPAPGWFSAATSGQDNGLAEGKALEGHDVVIGFQKSGITGWRFGYAAPKRMLSAPVWTKIGIATALGSLLIMVALMLAVRQAHRIALSMRALVDAAVALERDRAPPPLPPSGITEVQELSLALDFAGTRLHHAAAERETLLREEARRRREAEMAVAAKARFLAAASHDLRQPFQAMRLFHHLMLDGLRTDRAQEHHRHLGAAMESGEALLNALLDVSTLEAGTVRPHVVDLPLRPLLAAKLDEVRPAAAQKGLRLRLRACPAIVRSDPTLLGRIIGNLLANAVRYTAAGGILVGCRVHGTQLRIDVWDTGPGIPADKLDHVFEDFVQLDNAARDHRQGLGLGLSVVQRTARLLGHPLTVRSRVGKGSLFAVSVPLAARHEGQALLPPPRSRSAPPAPRRRVLVVEDQPDQRTALRHILEEAGHHVTTAADGPDALTIVARMEVPPDVIVTDYRLPGPLTGTQFVDHLDVILERRTPAVIVTGDTDPDRLREAATNGRVLLHKPIVPADLEEIVATVS